MVLTIGEPAPWFTAPTPSNPEYVFDTVAGRYVLLLFLPSEAKRRVKALQALSVHQAMFDDVRLSAFVVTREPETLTTARDVRGLRWFDDREGEISRRFGVVHPDGAEDSLWMVLDPSLRILATASIENVSGLIAYLRRLAPPERHAGVALHAPVIVAPRIFEPELCRELIALHEANGGQFTGVMRDQADRTVYVMDELKRRRDIMVRDPDLEAAIRERLERRVFPQIERAWTFRPTHIERYLVSCYDAQDDAVFHPHRDNTTFGTAHRAFACSINLNDDFDGGDLRFPEFGSDTYRPPLGGAVIFSCTLLHEAMKVTRGRRYAFLPFFYDEAGAAVLEAYEARTRNPETAQ